MLPLVAALTHRAGQDSVSRARRLVVSSRVQKNTSSASSHGTARDQVLAQAADAGAQHRPGEGEVTGLLLPNDGASAAVASPQSAIPAALATLAGLGG